MAGREVAVGEPCAQDRLEHAARHGLPLERAFHRLPAGHVTGDIGMPDAGGGAYLHPEADDDQQADERPAQVWRTGQPEHAPERIAVPASLEEACGEPAAGEWWMGRRR